MELGSKYGLVAEWEKLTGEKVDDSFKAKLYIEYRTQKDLPCKELYQLFLAVGWATRGKNNTRFNGITYGVEY